MRIGTALWLCAALTGPSATAEGLLPARPNVLLLVADDLGLGELGVYGNQSYPTPNLDRLAAEGMRFTSFYSNSSVCSPARIAILTGQYPQRHGARFAYAPRSDHGLPGDVPTIGSLLSSAGYRTHHVGKWHVGHGRDEFHPMERGFDGFFGFLEEGELPYTYRTPRLRRDRGPPQGRLGHLTDLLAAEAISFLEEQGDAPFFLQVWFFAPHAPPQPPIRWLPRFRNPRFGLVSALDENVGAILDALRSQGLEEDTLVLFTSDNGAHDPTFNGGLRGGKWSTFEGGLRVPLLVRWPGRVDASSRSDSRAAIFDILPTILEVAGIDDDGLALDGQSFLGSLLSRRARGRRVLFWEVLNRFAILSRGWKLLRSGEDKVFADDEPTGLVELGADPQETQDLSDEFPGRARLLRGRYASLRRDAMRIDYQVAALEGRVRRGTDTLCYGRTGGVARIDHDSRFDVSDGEFSISLWVKPSRLRRDALAVLVEKNGAWRLALTPDDRITVWLARKSADPIELFSKRAITSNDWTHVGLTIDRRRFSADTFLDVDLWIDGSASEGTRVTTEAPIAINESDLYIGNAADGQSAFVGALHEIAFFNADLDADEMAAIAARPGNPGSCRGGARAVRPTQDRVLGRPTTWKTAR